MSRRPSLVLALRQAVRIRTASALSFSRVTRARIGPERAGDSVLVAPDRRGWAPAAPCRYRRAPPLAIRAFHTKTAQRRGGLLGALRCNRNPVIDAQTKARRDRYVPGRSSSRIYRHLPPPDSSRPGTLLACGELWTMYSAPISSGPAKRGRRTRRAWVGLGALGRSNGGREAEHGPAHASMIAPCRAAAAATERFRGYQQPMRTLLLLSIAAVLPAQISRRSNRPRARRIARLNIRVRRSRSCAAIA